MIESIARSSLSNNIFLDSSNESSQHYCDLVDRSKDLVRRTEKFNSKVLKADDFCKESLINNLKKKKAKNSPNPSADPEPMKVRLVELTERSYFPRNPNLYNLSNEDLIMEKDIVEKSLKKSENSGTEKIQQPERTKEKAISKKTKKKKAKKSPIITQKVQEKTNHNNINSNNYRFKSPFYDLDHHRRTILDLNYNMQPILTVATNINNNPHQQLLNLHSSHEMKLNLKLAGVSKNYHNQSTSQQAGLNNGFTHPGYIQLLSTYVSNNKYIKYNHPNNSITMLGINPNLENQYRAMIDSNYSCSEIRVSNLNSRLPEHSACFDSQPLNFDSRLYKWISKN